MHHRYFYIFNNKSNNKTDYLTNSTVQLDERIRIWINSVDVENLGRYKENIFRGRVL